MNPAAEPPRIVSEPPTSRGYTDLSLHLTTLTLCSVVLLASFVLEIEGGSRVVVPGTALALPGVCWFRRILDMNCPGCGLTRCFISLAHGRVSDAFAFNAAGPLFFVLVVSQIPYQIGQLWRRRRGLPAWQLGTYGTVPVVAFAGALFAQWVIRLCAQFIG